jgi:hypothetical protein
MLMTSMTRHIKMNDVATCIGDLDELHNVVHKCIRAFGIFMTACESRMWLWSTF